MKIRIKIGNDTSALFGTLDGNIRELEKILKVTAHLTEDALEIEGNEPSVTRAGQFIEDILKLNRDNKLPHDSEIQSFLQVYQENPKATLMDFCLPSKTSSFIKRGIKAKSINQRRYLSAIEKHDMVFGVGPSGTGKTYLAVAMAVDSLLSKEVSRIILSRPAVEAGERLGFLPGTLQQKIDPYLRPLYDALFDVLDPIRAEHYIKKGMIEIAPLAFMRGRTLNEAFVILDESQNTTSEQMKMFLTRLGFKSKAVITGDVTQIDLPGGRRSGLIEALEIVKNVSGICFIQFNEKDVVRHNLVQQIIRAYEQFKRVHQPERVLKATERL